MSAVVEASGLAVRYRTTDVLRDLDVAWQPGEQVAVTGRSGGGKTTLLLTLAGLLTPTSGTVTWPALSPDARVRRSEIGMVFQAPSLMPELTAVENVTLPLRLRGVGVPEARRAAHAALATLGADDLTEALPAQLSGGQQQRVAIARVLAGGHRLVLADEPTGALDRARAQEVASALRDGVASYGGTLVVATHDPELAALFDLRLSLRAGRLESEVAA